MPSVQIKVEDGTPLAASFEIPRRYTPYVEKSSQAPVHVKVEEDAAPPAASPEKPRHYPSFSAFTEKWSQSSLRVPSPLAEEFYRSTIVKVEGEEALVHKKGLPLLCHDCERSADLIDKEKPPSETPRDLASPQPVSAIKTEAEPSPGYYIPTGAHKAKSTAPSVFSIINHQIPPTTDPSRLYHEARSPGRCTGTSSPTPCRPNTELSYLLPVTPTPFSTPNAPVNPYNRPAHLHCVPGSLLEGMRRRTKWGNRDIRDNTDDKERRARQAKQEKRAKQYKKAKQAEPATQLRSAPPAENVAENQHENPNEGAKNPEHGKTCTWYKMPFCRCCVCIMVVGSKLLRNVFVPSVVAVPRPHRNTSMIPTPKGWARRKKWWHLQRCKQPRQNVERLVDDESHAVRRIEFYAPGRVVVDREV